ncbi:MAG: transporter substrate-binding domain-containing protein [Betaproteobacteria bacterium]|nr:transporter substrate-binding domain-containing protein [Betaproteobacteria bacterium]
MLFCWLALLAGWSGAAENSSKKIVVATDDNYPPYVFRDVDGQLKGYLIDAWALWSQKTGIAVDVQASDWILAQQRFGSGEADVLDTVFDTPERQKTMSFSPPYADLPVQIFVHQSIQGIDNTKTLKAFSVGVKAGDACIDRLSESGVVRLDTYPSYEVLIGAAVAGDVRVFCLDEPPAHFLLARAGAEKDFRQAFTLYTGQFHRAVQKDNVDLLATVNRGFSAISSNEYEGLRDKWMGRVAGQVLRQNHGLLFVGGLGLGLLLLGWNFVLRRQVGIRTRELEAERLCLSTIRTGWSYIYIKGWIFATSSPTRRSVI